MIKFATKEWVQDTLRGQGALIGENGISAYEVAVENGFTGTQTEWLESLRGADGNDGNNGNDGQTPNIQIGTITTLEPDEQASAEIVGTSPELTLNLAIPKGRDGQDAITIDETLLMDKATFASETNEGSVKQADKIVGNPNPLQYYGTDINNNLGFHFFENAGGNADSLEVKQYVALECAANTDIVIGFSNFDESQKYNVQCYKLTDSVNDIVQTVKTFDNSESENFFYDSDNVEFTEDMHIKITHTYPGVLNSDGYYETSVIDKNEFEVLNQFYIIE